MWLRRRLRLCSPSRCRAVSSSTPPWCSSGRARLAVGPCEGVPDARRREWWTRAGGSGGARSAVVVVDVVVIHSANHSLCQSAVVVLDVLLWSLIFRYICMYVLFLATGFSSPLIFPLFSLQIHLLLPVPPLI
ncbi:hypothetical protein VPH35_027164 [Triticum aestivum]